MNNDAKYNWDDTRSSLKIKRNEKSGAATGYDFRPTLCSKFYKPTEEDVRGKKFLLSTRLSFPAIYSKS